MAVISSASILSMHYLEKSFENTVISPSHISD
jgi:hypothetical protein